MTQRARELRAQGRDIVVLGQGEPDFDTLVNIREAGKRAIDEGSIGYPAFPAHPRAFQTSGGQP